MSHKGWTLAHVDGRGGARERVFKRGRAMVRASDVEKFGLRLSENEIDFDEARFRLVGPSCGAITVLPLESNDGTYCWNCGSLM